MLSPRTVDNHLRAIYGKLGMSRRSELRRIIRPQVEAGNAIPTCYGIAPSGVSGSEVAANTLTAADIATGGVASAEVLNGSLTGTDRADNSLTGDDIDESTLNVGPRIRTTAVVGPGELNASYGVDSALSLPSGRWLILAKVTAYSRKFDPANEVLSATCRLRYGTQDLDQERVWG